MTRKLILLISITIVFYSANAQDFSTFLKENAVRIDKLDNLNKQVYDLLSDQQLIMVGEMHGTNEPAKFVTGLTKLFVENGDSVQVGFEIPSSQMTTFLRLHTDSSIFQSDFFSKSPDDGRASIAWATAISRISRIPKVQVFFYDVNGVYNNERDSLMYINIKSKLLEHPTWKTITLCGNIHNMLLPYKGKNKTAYYLSRDNELNLSDKLCSLNNQYQKGTANANFGKGLEIRDLGNIETEYSTTVDYDNYLVLFPINYYDSYDGIFFTRTITASALVNKTLHDYDKK